MPYPNLFIIGPPKCGTTSLYEWLAVHPETLPSKVKETYFFYDEADQNSPFPNYIGQGIQPFANLFEGYKDQKVIFEASPGHIYSSCIFDGIKQMEITPKALFIYRDPAERMYSEYKFQRYKTQLTQKSFRDFVGFDGANFNNQTLLRFSEYAPFLKNWVDQIGMHNLLIYTFHDIINAPGLVMKSIASQLQLDPSFYDNINLEAKNVTYQVRHRGFHKAALKAKRLIPDSMRKMLVAAYFKLNRLDAPTMTSDESEILDKLKQYYSPSMQEFDALFGPSIISLKPNNPSK